MITQVSSTIELNPELANLAYEMGLNASKICENALKSAISRLQGVNMNKFLVDEPGFEPGTSTMPTWRSCQTDLLAQSIWLLKVTHPRLISISYSWFFNRGFERLKHLLGCITFLLNIQEAFFHYFEIITNCQVTLAQQKLRLKFLKFKTNQYSR
jgi:hypothetical protein